MIKCGKCSKRDLWELGLRGDLICLREENKVTFKLAPAWKDGSLGRQWGEKVFSKLREQHT